MPSASFASPSVAQPRAQSRRRTLLGLASLAVLLHVAFFGGVGGVGGVRDVRRDRPTATPAVNVRVVDTEPAEPAKPDRAEPESAVPAPTGLAPQRPRRSIRGGTPAVVSVAPGLSAGDAPGVDTAVALPVDVPAPTADAPASMRVTAPAGPAASAALSTFLDPGELPPPTYRTALPPPATMRYEIRRGAQRGSGEIQWQRSGDSYALRLEARLDGVTVLAQTSEGTVGADGLAPTRFVDRRGRRSAQAANLHPDTGTVTFSGPATVWPLLAGSQDQLSWMVQLAGIVAAEPERASGGGPITMVVVGARGEAAVRTMRFVGVEIAEAADGRVVASLKFVVDGRARYDTSYEIWLDPARDHVPVHVRQRNAGGDVATEFLLQQVDPQ